MVNKRNSLLVLVITAAPGPTIVILSQPRDKATTDTDGVEDVNMQFLS